MHDSTIAFLICQLFGRVLKVSDIPELTDEQLKNFKRVNPKRKAAN